MVNGKSDSIKSGVIAGLLGTLGDATEMEAFVDFIAHLAYGAIASIYILRTTDTVPD